MGNQIAINSHTNPGDEVICENNCHCFNYEGGGPALLSGVQLFPLPGNKGVITALQIESVLRPPDHHFPRSQLIVLENTHNRAGGTIYPFDEIKNIYQMAQKYNLKMHLDGARLWNAHVATGIPLHDYARYFDSISVCLSKGLGAPIGSVLTGSKNFINIAHRYRKIYGGGMRQAGILAAAGLYALEHHVERLQQDHQKAGRLADCLNSLPNVSVDIEATKTNIVIADIDADFFSTVDLTNSLKEQRVLALPFSTNKIRFVTHMDLSDEDIDTAIKVIVNIFNQGGNRK